MMRFTRCLAASQGIRRLGSAALDLGYVAAGRFEAFWEEHLHPWDVAAGHLIVTEAGGQVTNFDNHPFEVEMKSILASNGRIHNDMLNLLEVKEGE
jgi:myo-inositol-1(or 4)-monophosphatase